MRVGSAVVMVVLLALLSACGGGSSASDRMAACRQRYRAGLTDTPAARRAVSELCAQAEQAGLLDDHGATTADQLRTLLKTHPAALSPLCQLSLQTSLGATTAAAARYLPPGGVHALTAKACHNLGPFLTDDGLDQRALFRARGRGVLVPVCVAGSLASPHNQSLPYSAADTRTLLTRICRQAWVHGLLHADGSVDLAALAALGTRISRQMLASGQITAQR
ncbi:MAG: hypothetical protein ACJ738_08975 [Gaiellales bacterium]